LKFAGKDTDNLQRAWRIIIKKITFAKGFYYWDSSQRGKKKSSRNFFSASLSFFAFLAVDARERGINLNKYSCKLVVATAVKSESQRIDTTALSLHYFLKR
jgi:hypothetical protein